MTPTEETFKVFEKRISRPRLHRYRRTMKTKEEAIALYLWNVALSEALYPALHFFEIALRNATHDALTAHFGKPNWFVDPLILTENRHQEQVLEAIQKLRRDRKGQYLGSDTDLAFPREPGRVVAELSLGFWVNLYSDPYASTLVRWAATNAFPNAPDAVRLRRHQSAIYPRLREVVDLRNRIFHNEPIYHWSNKTPGQSAVSPSLLDRYQRLRETIGWMCDVQLLFLDPLDRFEKVHAEGWEAFLDEVQFAFLTDEEKAGGTS